MPTYTDVIYMKIPQEVQVSVSGLTVSVKGPKGDLSRTFRCENEIQLNGDEFEVTGPLPMTNTIKGHVGNMITGVTEGYERKMKAVYSHFPMTIEVKGSEITIKNFLGERKPRKTKVVGKETKVQVKGQELTITGINKEDVGQTVANLRTATKITKKDSRIFQDGIYPALE